MPPAGRLTLSWVGKDQALLPTAGGGYEWVERDDPRVTEVRLLRDGGSVGEAVQSPSEGNLLITGDSYNALRALAHIPEYAKEYRGKVAVVYITVAVSRSVTALQLSVVHDSSGRAT
jgi:adenine-specific DNA-methyltransferase